MTTQSHPRPSFVNGPVIFFVAFAIVVSAAIAAVRVDWQGSGSKPTTENNALAPSIPGVGPTAQELFASEMAITEAQWDATFGPLQHNVTPYDEVARALAEHENAMTAVLGTTASFETSFGPAPMTDDEILATILAEHEAWIAAYLGQ